MPQGLQCQICANYLGGLSCTAFPRDGGIPHEILSGQHDHEKKPWPGDNGIRWRNINQKPQILGEEP